MVTKTKIVTFEELAVILVILLITIAIGIFSQDSSANVSYQKGVDSVNNVMSPEQSKNLNGYAVLGKVLASKYT